MTGKPNTQGNSEYPIGSPDSSMFGKDVPSGEPEGWTRYDDPPLPEDFWKMVDEGEALEIDEEGSEQNVAAPTVEGDTRLS